jgi:hypothetical protein
MSDVQIIQTLAPIFLFGGIAFIGWILIRITRK